MPDANPVAGLYPQPPQQQQQQNSLMNNPGQILGMVSAARGLQGQQAMKNALQGAIGADGSYNPNAALSALKNDPNAWIGQGDVNSILDARTRNINNSTLELGLGVANNAAAAAILGSYAQKKNLGPSDLAEMRAKLAAAGVNPSTVGAFGVNSSPKDLKSVVSTAATQAMGAGAAASPVQGPVATNGATTQTTVGAQQHGGQPIATSLPSGAPEALQANQKEFTDDQSAAAQRLASIRPLQQALPLIQQLSSTNFGPGSDQFAKVKGALVTAGIINPNTSDLQVREEANKYLHQYAGQARGADRSDQGLAQVRSSTPNADLTQPANMALIKNQIGMDRMDAAIPTAFGNSGGNPQQYKGFKSNAYQNLDPRAFSFDMMSPAERADLQKSLGPKPTPGHPNPTYDKFVQSYNIAKRSGVLGAQNGQ